MKNATRFLNCWNATSYDEAGQAFLPVMSRIIRNERVKITIFAFKDSSYLVFDDRSSPPRVIEADDKEDLEIQTAFYEEEHPGFIQMIVDVTNELLKSGRTES